MFELCREKQQIVIEEDLYTPKDILSPALPRFAKKSPFCYEVYEFLKEWFSETETMTLNTSGSTGSPKQITVYKKDMMQSAIITCQFLNLKKYDKTLLCMPLSSIAGKMLIVRALVAGLDLYPVTPGGNPLKDTEINFQFAAMVPLQVFNSLQSEVEKERLKHIKNLIIGGGAIDKGMEVELQLFPNNVYSTYGMTETLSHIAIRKLNGKDTYAGYIPLPSVKVSLSEDDCLIVNAPMVCPNTLYTNDIAQIDADGAFRIIGRKDNVINSGGIKIQIEQVEEKLKTIISCPFAISAYPDAKFGEIVVLLTEKPVSKEKIQQSLPHYMIPKKIILTETIPLTRTSKIDRVAVRKLVNKLTCQVSQGCLCLLIKNILLNFNY